MLQSIIVPNIDKNVKKTKQAFSGPNAGHTTEVCSIVVRYLTIHWKAVLPLELVNRTVDSDCKIKQHILGYFDPIHVFA